jgi:phosphate transport system permease protein
MKENTESTKTLNRQISFIYRRPGDQIFKTLVIILATSVLFLALGMGLSLWLEAYPAFQTFGLFNFLIESDWDPINQLHGALPFLLGTLLTSFLALGLAILPSIAIAIYVSEYASPLVATIINYLVDLLAAVPSVVIGLWAIFNFAPVLRDVLLYPFFQWAEINARWLLPIIGENGPAVYNITSATIILALMIVPYTVALSRDAIKMVPKEQTDAAWALGATKWEVVQMAILPFASSGIYAGALLSLARALGETMAVAMLIGNSNKLPLTLFGPAATMPSLIINEFREAVENIHLSSIMAVGFYLFVITIGINLFSTFIQHSLFKEKFK